MAILRYSSFSVIFFVLARTFLTLGPFLGATPLPKKKTNLIFWKTILCWTCWKKIFSKISKNKGPRPTLKIVGRAISSHIINFWFLPFSGHFRTLGEIFFASSRRTKISWCWRKKNRGDISSRSDFIADSKKSLFRYIYITSREHPPMGGYNPPPLPLPKVRWLRMTLKKTGPW